MVRASGIASRCMDTTDRDSSQPSRRPSRSLAEVRPRAAYGHVSCHLRTASTAAGSTPPAKAESAMGTLTSAGKCRKQSATVRAGEVKARPRHVPSGARGGGPPGGHLVVAAPGRRPDLRAQSSTTGCRRVDRASPAVGQRRREVADDAPVDADQNHCQRVQKVLAARRSRSPRPRVGEHASTHDTPPPGLEPPGDGMLGQTGADGLPARENERQLGIAHAKTLPGTLAAATVVIHRAVRPGSPYSLGDGDEDADPSRFTVAGGAPRRRGST